MSLLRHGKRKGCAEGESSPSTPTASEAEGAASLMEAQSQHGPESKMGRREKKRALEEVRKQGHRHRAEVEAKVAAVERPPSAPRSPSPSVGAPAPRPAPGWAADHMAAAMPLTAAAMPSVDGARVMPTDPEGLRRLSRSLTEMKQVPSVGSE